MGRRNHYHVYVIELSPDVLFELKFKKCNPGYITGKLCVYVGMTGLDLGFNRWMQQIEQIALLVFGSLVFFLGVHSTSSLLH